VAAVPSGQIAYVATTSVGTEIDVVNPDGTGHTRLTTSSGGNTSPDWSPDGTKIVYVNSGHVWLMNANGSAKTQLTNVAGEDARHPSWSRDGTTIAFTRATSGGASHNIYTMTPAGTNQTRRTTGTADDQSPTWSPDGTHIAFNRWDLDTGTDTLEIIKSDGSNRVAVSLDFRPIQPSWSPDGTRFAVVDFDTGDLDTILVGGTGKTRIDDLVDACAKTVGGAPAWAPDGTKILYGKPDPSYRCSGLSDLTASGLTLPVIGAMPSWGTNTTHLVSPDTSYPHDSDSGFSIATLRVRQGNNVDWIFAGTGFHSVLDNSALHLFNSQRRPPPNFFVYTFNTACTFPILDHYSGHTMTVAVPTRAAPSTGSLTTSFTVTWSVTAPPAGLTFDAQIKRPNGAWTTWRTGTLATQRNFAPDAGPGAYSFRARLRNNANASCGWSPATTITVTS
jgi:TolB protein